MDKKLFYDEEDMKANGWTCGLHGFWYGLLGGAILTFVGLWGLAEYLGVK